MKHFNEIGETLGANVGRLRKEQELSKKSFALMSGISRPFLDKIENGKSNVQLSYVQQLADALCVEPYELLLVGRPDDSNATQTRLL